MKKALFIAGGIAVATTGYILYKRLVPPSFQIVEYTPSTHSGKFEFGGTRNSFSPNGSAVYGVRNIFGSTSNVWSLRVQGNSNGTVSFTLLKNGKDYKVLAENK